MAGCSAASATDVPSPRVSMSILNKIEEERKLEHATAATGLDGFLSNLEFLQAMYTLAKYPDRNTHPEKVSGKYGDCRRFIRMASVMPSEALPALNCMPTEILDLIFARFSPLNLWHLRRTSKRFNAVLHPHLLSTLRAMAEPLPLTLVREAAPVPLSFVYSLVLAVLGHDEGRKLWGRIFPSRDTSPETPYSSWLPATPPHFLLPPPIDQDLSPAAIRRQNEINAHPDLFIPHLRAASPSLENLRRIHFWSILLWYKESSDLSLAEPPALEADRARKDRLRWAYTQHRDNYESRPGDEPAAVDEFTRTYILRSHFDRPAPSRSDKDPAALHMRSRRPRHSGPPPPELDYWLHGVTARDRPPDYLVPSRMRRRPWRSEEYKEARRLIFATHAEFERNG